MSMIVKTESKTEVAELLKTVVADQFILYTKARNYHWNVTGTFFMVLHQSFEKLYTDLEQDIDLVAERIRALGEYAPGTMGEFLKLSKLKEEREGVVPDQMKMTRNIVSDLSILVKGLNETTLRMNEEFQDDITNGMILGLTEKYEKYIWMLKSTSEEK